MPLFQVTETFAVYFMTLMVYLVHTGIRDEELYVFLCKIYFFLGDGSSTLKKFLFVKLQLWSCLLHIHSLYLYV